MTKSSRTITVYDLIKCILILNMCRTIISDADPKFGDIYLKMCSVLKLPKFCLSYMMGSYSYPYPFYALPLPAPVPLPVAPFPLIVNPTSSIPSFTIPTVFTTNRPGGAPPGPPGPPGVPPGPSAAPPPQLPPPGKIWIKWNDEHELFFIQVFIIGLQCPPSPPICPPAALAMPIIDPRQGNNIQQLPLVYVAFDSLILNFFAQ